MTVLLVEEDLKNIDFLREVLNKYVEKINFHAIASLEKVKPLLEKENDVELLIISYTASEDNDTVDRLYELNKSFFKETPVFLVRKTQNYKEETRKFDLYENITMFSYFSNLSLLEEALDDLLEQYKIKTDASFTSEQNQLAFATVSEFLKKALVATYKLTIKKNEMVVFHWISENIKSITGYSAREAMKKSWWINGIHPDEKENVMHFFKTCQMRSGEHVISYRFQHFDGDYVFVKNRFFVSKTPEDELFIIGAWIDTTKDFESNFLLELKQKALSYINIPIIITDSNANIIYANKAFSTLSGYKKSDVLNKTPKQIVSSKLNSKKVYKDLWRTILSGKTWKGELLNKKKDGTIYHEELSIMPIMGKNLKPTHFIAIKKDISKRKKDEEDLQNAAVVFQNLHDAIVITDLEGVVISANDAFLKIAKEDDIIGKIPIITKYNIPLNEFYKNIESSLVPNGHWQGDVICQDDNNKTVTYWVSISTIYDDRQAPIRYATVFTNITSIKESEAKIKQLAYYDQLTQVPNRVFALERIQKSIEDAKKTNEKVGMAYFDLDRFKTINDSLGHHFGDELLLLVVKRLNKNLPNNCTLSRFGGDEFLLIVENFTEIDDLKKIGSSIITLLNTPFKLSNNHEIYISTSIGISIYPNDSKNLNELIQHSDMAMYMAKKSGGSQYVFYDSKTTYNSSQLMQLETSLHKALKNDEFRLYYQPQIDIKTGKIIGAEALLRWIHPQKGIVMPGDFIPIAEETGIIVSIGSWIIKEACKQLRIWQRNGYNKISLSVNVSAKQINNHQSIEEIKQIIKESKIDPTKLTIELTESTLMEQTDKTLEILKSLKELKVKLSIDDFGTGYSSLVYLKRFPIDELKIDKDFVKHLEKNEEDQQIIKMIISLAKTLGLSTLAEGVDNKAQLDFLSEQGCDECQGYYFSKALSLKDFDKFIEKNL